MFAHLKRLIQITPKKPGVYLMKNQLGKVIYVGKAKNLQTRLNQYVQLADTRAQIPYLLEQIDDIKTIIVASEKEALLLENNLIKKHKPKYNVLFKDDKTYISLFINTEHAFPTIHLQRVGKTKKRKGLYFGPFTNTYVAKQTLKLMFELFHLRQCSDQEFTSRSRPCLLQGLKLCDAPCVGLISSNDYQKKVDNVSKFLNGKGSEILDHLKKRREEFAKKLEFEKASELQMQIENIKKLLQKQSVHTLSKKNIDVFGFAHLHSKTMITCLRFTQGKLLETANYFFEIVMEEKEKLLERFLLERYPLLYQKQSEIILPFLRSDPNVVRDLLVQKIGSPIKIVIPKKGKKLDVVSMANQNAKSAMQKQISVDRIDEKSLLDLQEKLHLSDFPQRIECIDPSHLSGQDAVGALVTFINGKKDTKFYRRYKLSSKASDDYAAISEIIQRRFKKGEDLPDLLMIDGGKGHLTVALKALLEGNIIGIDVIAISKEKQKHTKGLTQEQVYKNDYDKVIQLEPKDEALFLLQRIRDEAHRFAISYQKVRRKKSLVKTKIDQIPTIGPKKRKLLFDHFGSYTNLSLANRGDLEKIKGLSKTNIDYILDYIKD